MVELINDTLVFQSDVHANAKCIIELQRTLRIPDDGKTYPLPPGLGRFPIQHLDAHKERVPSNWMHRGGVITPLYQSEALWLKFSSAGIDGQGRYPFAIKVAAGKVSAITGEEWKPSMTPNDYVVTPGQPWLDGYAVSKGKIRQFIAAPLGSGYTAEEQITGKAEFGGIQIEVFPMKIDVFNRRFPYKPPVWEAASARISKNGGFSGFSGGITTNSLKAQSAGRGPMRSRGSAGRGQSMNSGLYSPQMDSMSMDLPSMGLGAGGQMEQTIQKDPFDFNDWDTSRGQRVFIHLANSLVWRAITGQEPPHPPPTAADYTRQGFPWFDYYQDGPALDGTAKLANLKSVAQLDQQKYGAPVLPENASTHPIHVVQLGDKNPNKIREGTW